MSGRRISDHGGWPASSDAAMKSKNKVMHYHSAEGSGHLGSQYHDTSEEIKQDQSHGDSKIKSHGIKPGYRN